MTDTELFAAFTAATDDVNRLEAGLAAAKEDLASLERLVLAGIERTGINNVRIHGSLIYLHSQLWARLAGGQNGDLRRDFAAAGVGHLLQTTANANTLSAYVRGEIEEGRDLHPAIKPHVIVRQEFSARVRRG